jgi:hypothetical protein
VWEPTPQHRPGSSTTATTRPNFGSVDWPCPGGGDWGDYDTRQQLARQLLCGRPRPRCEWKHGPGAPQVRFGGPALRCLESSDSPLHKKRGPNQDRTGFRMLATMVMHAALTPLTSNFPMPRSHGMAIRTPHHPRASHPEESKCLSLVLFL